MLLLREGGLASTLAGKLYFNNDITLPHNVVGTSLPRRHKVCQSTCFRNMRRRLRPLLPMILLAEMDYLLPFDTFVFYI